MWKYIKRYIFFMILAGMFMACEVSMDLMQPKIMSKIVDDGVLGLNNGGIGNLQLVWKFGLKMIFFVLVGCLCGTLNDIFVNISGQNIGNNMRKDCFKRIMTFSFPQIDTFGTGSLVTRVTNDITQVQTFISQAMRGMLRTFLLMFGSIFCMFRINYNFGLAAVCAFLIIFVYIIVCTKKTSPLFVRLQERLDLINEIMQEDISGIRMIKACVREIYEKVRFGKANEELVKTQFKVLIIFAFISPVINILMYIVITLIIVIGSLNISNTGISPGDIMAAITYTTQLLNSMLMLIMLFQNISRGMTSWKRVKEIIYTQMDLKDGTFDGDTELKGEIELRDVSFAYPESKNLVLKHINLTVHKGETLAIMGVTGCGKTSIVNLIARFYDASGGSVLIDGIDVKQYKKTALREKIAISMQKSELFNITIRDNIKFGTPDANYEQIIRAAEIAQADKFISETPYGYDTIISERGMSLSGGQRQRISSARTILKTSEIVILDDATSALDLKTEAGFYEAIKEINPESTKIIIAQRIASVRLADKIAVLDNGSIVGCGSHEELIKSCKIYQDIYYSQIGDEERNNGKV